MPEFNITDIVNFTLLTNPTINFKGAYTFYYDETNNIGKFHIQNNDFNVAFSSNFVLGGFAYSGSMPDISKIFDGISFQANTDEIKFKHIAHGDFLTCLTSRKLNKFLQNALSFPIYFHYSSLNLLYYSIVDIVDSAVSSSSVSGKIGLDYINYIKDCLYIVAVKEITAIKALFYKYKYPNVGDEEIPDFISDLSYLIEKHLDDTELHVGLSSIIQMLKEAEKNKSLPFVMENDNHILIDGLAPFYARPVYTFINSDHIFDDELQAKKNFDECTYIYEGNEIKNYRFVDSKADTFTQASDIIIGLEGKFSKFINEQSEAQITTQINNLNELQKENLDLYLDLILKSEHSNQGFFHHTDSSVNIAKRKLIFEFRGKI